MNHGDICPCCQKKKVRRIQRKPWMRRVPRSKHFYCASCQTHFLTICGWRFRLPKKSKPKSD